jgi:VWFA-related protein
MRAGRDSIKRQAMGAMGVCALALLLAMPVFGQSGGQAGSQNPQQPAGSSQQQSQDIPDAPSAVQPPAPKPFADTPPAPIPQPRENGEQAPANDSGQPDQGTAPPPMPPVKTIPPGSGPRNQVNPADDIYKITTTANFVQIPVMVKDKQGRRVDGLSPKDFEVRENGKPQKLTFFTSDPYLLSVAIVLDTGMADVTLQKVHETYGALVGAFSPYDEYALYTYSSTVSQVTDYTAKPQLLTAALDQMKSVTGRYNGPPDLGGRLASGPTVNGAPVGGPTIQPVNTPPRESYVLNDAILRAAVDLAKRDRTRRKVIFVISDGRELGSRASYRDVLQVLETQGIQVKAVVVDTGALPVYKQIERFRIKGQGYSDILPRYTNATGGGKVYSELSRNAMEDAYNEITSEARNQYTLGYVPQAVKGSSPYRSLEVVVFRKDLNVYTKAGYYPIPALAPH